ncbi:MAG: LysR family transcriptional regulator [Myxococcales bacterium]|nr:LysR family transcriptional regulator [Myxococcales bacterium]
MELDMFRGIVPFVAVAEEGSVRRAAVRLGVSPAAVSKAVARLEASVGLALIARGGRRATLTREGEVFFGRCRPAVAAVEHARATLDEVRREPAGELVLSVPFVATALVSPVLTTMHLRHPRLRFQLKVSDAQARLAEERVDVAVRIGMLTDSSLVARRLRGTRLLTVASPGYLARRGELRQLDDLDAHDCLVLIGPSGRPWPWMFASGPRPVAARLTTDHGPSVVDAALAGLGVTQAFDFMVEPLVRTGRLVTLLPDDVGAGPDVHAICSPGRRATPRVRAAFDAFADAFA